MLLLVEIGELVLETLKWSLMTTGLAGQHQYQHQHQRQENSL